MGGSNSRVVRILIVAFLVILLIAGIVVRSLIRKNITDSALSDLENSSQVLSELAAAYYEDGTLTNMQFIINLDLVSRVSGIDVLVCNENGKILLCSDSPTGCIHQKYYLSESYMTRIRNQGHVSNVSILKNVYKDRRYISARPIYSSANGAVVGYTIASTPISEASKMATWISNFFLLGIASVTIISAVFMIFISNHKDNPLRIMARTARDFGHGDLDARVHLQGHHSLEITDLALAFNNMASSLQKSEYSRQEFVANVSHELKTPMTTIGGYIDGILDGTIPPEKSRQYMQVVSEETKRLSRLVRSMLDISQLQSQGGLPEEKKVRFDIEECLGQILITFEQKILAKNLNVEVEMPEYPVFTFAQRDYISQVIYNLLDNAVKFCPEGGTLRLRVVPGVDKLYISVANAGPTIPPEELSLLFDRFHKIDKSRTENRDGWGLGLYIVKTIIGLHGEDISVTSADGFTEFTFTLPEME